MDLLRSVLNIDDLPEQQTRMAHLVEEYPDFNLNLGFDSCCTCGAPDPKVSCLNCGRVNYCSDACREKDTIAINSETVDDEEPETAMGHSSIVCALLKTCADDEMVEEGTSDNEAARNRIQSEFESYPATLANAISEGPVFQSVLRSNQKLVIHVIGASTDAEFWDNEEDGIDAVVAAYAEALSETTERFALDTVELYFIGPDCPSSNVKIQREMRSSNLDKKTGSLLFCSIKGAYSNSLLLEHGTPSANIVVFFNPGFTVPEYSWKETLETIPKGTPFLSTTNTEVEGIADTQFLLDLDRIQSLPPGLADIFGMYSESEEEMAENAPFFTENPFCGNRVRQSGTMANDLFVKNRWMLGGIMDSYNPSAAKSDASSKRVRTSGGDANEKKGNPALI